MMLVLLWKNSDIVQQTNTVRINFVFQIFFIVFGVVAKQYLGTIKSTKAVKPIKIRLPSLIYKARRKSSERNSVLYDVSIVKNGRAAVKYEVKLLGSKIFREKVLFPPL